MKPYFINRGLFAVSALLFSCTAGGNKFTHEQEAPAIPDNRNSKIHIVEPDLRCPDDPVITVQWADSNASSVKYLHNDCYDDSSVELVNHTYLYSKASSGRRPDRHAPLFYIISQKQVWRPSASADSHHSELHAHAFKIEDGGVRTGLWSLDADADIGQIPPLWDDVYETVKYGCCESCSLFTLYDLETGTLINKHTGNLLVVTGRNHDFRRYIGYTTWNHAGNRSDASDTSFIGTLTYSSRDSLLQTITFHAAAPGRRPLSGFLEFVVKDSNNFIYRGNELSLPSEDGASITGFGVKIRFERRHIRGSTLFEAMVDIIADRLHIDTTDRRYYKAIVGK